MNKVLEKLVKKIDKALQTRSYEQIAQKCGVVRSTIWRIHRGKMDNLTIKTIEKIINGLKSI